MSAEAGPISPTRFATAIQDLPVETLYAKAVELRNSIEHLVASNEQLKEFANSGDQDCAEAIRENDEVIQRMEHRILLLEFEVEVNRKMKWHGDDGRAANGTATAQEDMDTIDGTNGGGAQQNGNGGAISDVPTTSGSLSDIELQRLVVERLEEEGDNNDGGVYLGKESLLRRLVEKACFQSGQVCHRAQDT
jgi:hypothetical protein